MSDGPVIVGPGEGHRVGNVEFLARTADTPRFNFGIIEMAPGREMRFFFGDESAVASPGTFVLVPPGVSHGFENEGHVPVRMLNIHAPAGFDRRIGLPG
jgi:hypothetical protein